MSIEIAARALAAAEAALSKAEELHHQRITEAQTVEARLAEAEAKCTSIRERSNSGELDQAQAGGLYAMSVADRDDLAFLHAEALRAVRDTEPNKQRGELAAAQSMFERARDQAELQALKERAEAIDQALVSVLKQIGATNQRLSGRPSIGGTWGASPRLREAIAFGKVPQ